MRGFLVPPLKHEPYKEGVPTPALTAPPLSDRSNLMHQPPSPVKAPSPVKPEASEPAEPITSLRCADALPDTNEPMESAEVRVLLVDGAAQFAQSISADMEAAGAPIIID